MTDQPKRRGRPKGSEIDDHKVLAAMADRIVADPNLKPTAAIRQINRNAGEAEVRRWQHKWKHRKSELLAAAKSRRARHQNAAATTAAHRRINSMVDAMFGTRSLSAAFDQQDRLQREIDRMFNPARSDTLAAALGIRDTALERAARGMLGTDSALENLARGISDDPLRRVMDEERRLQDMFDPYRSIFGR